MKPHPAGIYLAGVQLRGRVDHPAARLRGGPRQLASSTGATARISSVLREMRRHIRRACPDWRVVGFDLRTVANGTGYSVWLRP